MRRGGRRPRGEAAGLARAGAARLRPRRSSGPLGTKRKEAGGALGGVAVAAPQKKHTEGVLPSCCGSPKGVAFLLDFFKVGLPALFGPAGSNGELLEEEEEEGGKDVEGDGGRQRRRREPYQHWRWKAAGQWSQQSRSPPSLQLSQLSWLVALPLRRGSFSGLLLFFSPSSLLGGASRAWICCVHAHNTHRETQKPPAGLSGAAPHPNPTPPPQPHDPQHHPTTPPHPSPCLRVGGGMAAAGPALRPAGASPGGWASRRLPSTLPSMATGLFFFNF